MLFIKHLNFLGAVGGEIKTKPFLWDYRNIKQKERGTGSGERMSGKAKGAGPQSFKQRGFL